MAIKSLWDSYRERPVNEMHFANRDEQTNKQNERNIKKSTLFGECKAQLLGELQSG